jgi:hypothetical protein
MSRSALKEGGGCSVATLHTHLTTDLIYVSFLHCITGHFKHTHRTFYCSFNYQHTTRCLDCRKKKENIFMNSDTSDECTHRCITYCVTAHPDDGQARPKHVAATNWEGVRGGAVGWGTALQVERWRVRFPIESLKFFRDLILPVALWRWGRPSL